MLNLVVADMAASLAFYRRLGTAVPEGQDAAAIQVQLRMPGGSSSTPRKRCAVGTPTAAPTRRAHAWSNGFSPPTRDAVDERYAELTPADYAGAPAAVRRLMGVPGGRL